jgi:hypothetical protein
MPDKNIESERSINMIARRKRPDGIIRKRIILSFKVGSLKFILQCFHNKW